MTVLLSIALAYVGVLAAVYFGQASLLYFPGIPSRELSATPLDIGLEYENVTLTAKDGAHLHGWWIPHPRPRAVLLHLHGNAGNVSHRLELIRIFHHLGLSVLIFDYRGHGRSQGKPSEEGTVRCPVLVIHSPDDEIIPYAHGQRLYATAAGPKVFLKLRGDHNTGFLMSGRDYVHGLDAFLREHLGR